MRSSSLSPRVRRRIAFTIALLFSGLVVAGATSAPAKDVPPPLKRAPCRLRRRDGRTRTCSRTRPSRSRTSEAHRATRRRRRLGAGGRRAHRADEAAERRRRALRGSRLDLRAAGFLAERPIFPCEICDRRRRLGLDQDPNDAGLGRRRVAIRPSSWPLGTPASRPRASPTSTDRSWPVGTS